MQQYGWLKVKKKVVVVREGEEECKGCEVEHRDGQNKVIVFNRWEGPRELVICRNDIETDR